MEGLKSQWANIGRRLEESKALCAQVVQECDWLQRVEVELNECVKMLTAKAAALKASHLKEMAELEQARKLSEEGHLARYATVTGELQSLEEGHRRQVQALNAKVDAAHGDLRQLNQLVASMHVLNVPAPQLTLRH